MPKISKGHPLNSEKTFVRLRLKLSKSVAEAALGNEGGSASESGLCLGRPMVAVAKSWTSFDKKKLFQRFEGDKTPLYPYRYVYGLSEA